jgi:hypothetical protein
VIYIQGKGGVYANMDIDCDGAQRTPNNGRCGVNPTDQSHTAMRSYLQAYRIAGVTDLDPYRHPFVVFGNDGLNSNNVNFDPMAYGIQPLSIIFVVTLTQLVSIS